jgi:hypothetical protein
LGGALAEELSGLAGWSKFTAPFQRAEFLRGVAHQQLLLELAEISRSLSTESLLVKGMALVQTAYRGRIGLRPIGDADLVLAEGCLPEFERALVKRGFRRLDEEGSSFQRDDHLVDLHYDLLNARRVPSRSRAYALDAATFRSHSRPLEGALRGLRIPDPIDHLTFLAVHALKHSHSRLFWLVDMALLSQHCSEGELLERARQTRTERPLAYAFTLLDTVLGLPTMVRIPVASSKVESVYLEWVASRRNLHGLGELLTCLSLPSRAAVGVYLGELLWPRRGDPRGLLQRLRCLARRLWDFVLGRHG